MLMCGGQGRPRQPHHGFAYPLQLPVFNFLPRLHILVVSFNFEVKLLTLSYRCWSERASETNEFTRTVVLA